ncbi:hypothetical protein ISS09_03445 [Candidatus Woesearchaeota archaeon]|nr:hypothetical protein [Candidatus Woesearchaeota archaeon]
MKRVEDFLEEAKQLSDTELTEKFGVYDNWKMLVQHHHLSLASGLIETNKFSFARLINIHGGRIVRLDHLETANVEIMDYLLPERTIDETIMFQQCFKANGWNHNLTLQFHPQTSDGYHKGGWDERWIRNVFQAIDDVSQYLIQEGIPACYIDARPRGTKPDLENMYTLEMRSQS